jgi:hypothetical protein
VAIPTDFQGFTPAATVTKTFKILGSATVGIWACDVDGTLSATSFQVPIAPNLILFMDQAYTDAQLIVVVKDWLARMGAFHEGAGGQAVEVTKQLAFTGTTTT